MKKVLVSSIVVAGIAVLGGGAYLWPKSEHVASSQSAVSSSVVTSQSKSHKTAKQNGSESEQATSKSQSEKKATSSKDSSQTTSSKQASATTTLSSAASSSQAESTSPSSNQTSTTAGQNLTSAQLDNWIWTKVAQQYQGASVTKSDFGFQEYNRDGLVYVDVYEKSSTEADHLAGRYRVNAQGNLEQQSLSNGGNWNVVSTSPAN